MLRKTIITVVALSVFIALPAFAKKKGGPANACKTKDVAGSYTRVIAYQFPNGYGDDVDRTTVRQLNLHSDGIAHQFQSDGFDFALNYYSRTEWNGSWACQDDGSVVVTMMTSWYASAPPDAVFPGSTNDSELVLNQKTTYRFNVDDKNTLTLLEAAVRNYGMTDDPSDPAAGFLDGPYAGGSATYSRLMASDADLLP